MFERVFEEEEDPTEDLTEIEEGLEEMKDGMEELKLQQPDELAGWEDDPPELPGKNQFELEF